MSNNRYIYGEQFAQKLPGSDQNFYFRTITGYEVDNNGKPIEGTARTDLYYAPKPGKTASGGKTWTPGKSDSIDGFNPGGWVRAGSTSDNGKSYAFLFYTQEDADLGRIPDGKKVGDEVLGATAQQSLTTSGGRFYEAVQNNLINLAVNTQPGLAQVVSAKQKNAAQQQQNTRTDGTNTDSDSPKTNINTEDLVDQIEADNKETAWSGKIYRYPTKIDDNRQDYIKFEVYDYKTRRPSKENPLIQEKNRNLGSSTATIILPIQPSITDTNTVDWNGLGLNPVELAGYGLSSAAMTGGSSGNDFSEILGKLGNTVTRDPNTQKAILLYLKQRAIGVNGLLSRFGGAIVNPNIELLFQGPQLRPFNFSFRLSPRDRDEAKQVKSIIRVFKEAMSVKTASGGLFLATPNVFNIKYINGTTKEEHTSLNKIKTCALQSCSVDYTPDGSYMTFNDINSGYPMTSYNLTLQFQELEPVTDNDYKSLKDVTTIGY